MTEAASPIQRSGPAIEQSLRDTLLRPPAPKKPYRLKLPTAKGRLRPGVDITDRKSLYDLMDGIE